MRRLLIAGLAIAASAGATQAQDLSAGETSFGKCAPCRSIGEDAANKVGPILNGLDGRKAGMVEGFNYSDANNNSGITWNEASFEEYIKDLRAKLPGTKMVFAGIKNDKELKDLWGYLTSNSLPMGIKSRR
jgi:cytochrome c